MCVQGWDTSIQAFTRLHNAHPGKVHLYIHAIESMSIVEDDKGRPAPPGNSFWRPIEPRPIIFGRPIEPSPTTNPDTHENVPMRAQPQSHEETGKRQVPETQRRVCVAQA